MTLPMTSRKTILGNNPKMCTKMKKFNSIILAAMGMAALAVSCKQEGLEPVAPEEGQTIKVEVSLGETLKGTFTDREGLRWEVGDQLKYAGGVHLTSSPLAAEDITSEGSVASFTFPAELTSADRNGWFVSTNNHPDNYDEVAYTLGVDGGNVYTQDNAGEMNHRRLFLHSGLTTMNIAKGQEKITVKMDICGTILRAMPYTTMYNDETVQSVSLASNSYIVGTVAYDRGADSYKPIAGNDYTGACVDWKKYNNVIVNLGNAFSLSGVVDKEKSKGIYIPIAASYKGFPYKGYKYVVTTDKAQYVFDAMDKTLVAGENVVKNVYLNLDKATRQEHASGTLRYDVHLQDVTAPASESADNYCGYSVAMTKDGDAAEVKREGPEYYDLYYKNVKFTCTDPDSKEPVDWVSVRYNTDNAHVLANVSANTGAERKALVTITYSDVRNYVIEETSKTATFTITQKAADSKSSVKAWGSWGGNIKEVELSSEGCTSVTSQNGAVFGYVIVTVDGKEIFSGYDDADVFARTSFICVDESAFEKKDFAASNIDWLSCDYLRNAAGGIQDRLWSITASANTSGSTRVGYIVYTFDEDPKYEYDYGVIAMKITQTSSLNATASFVNASSEKVSKDGGVVKTTLSLTIDGTAQADVAKAIADYGLTLETSSAVESHAIAANGEVTLNVKANATSTERKITLTLKHNTTVLATTEFTQEAGEGGAVGHTYSYRVFNNAVDGSKTTGFGPAAGSVGDWYRIENVTIDGKTYMPGEDMKNLVNDTELINALTSHIFSFGEITESDVQVPGTDPLTTDPESFVELVPWTDGGAAVYFRIVFKNGNTTGARRTFKVITKDGEGKVTSTIVYFQNA